MPGRTLLTSLALQWSLKCSQHTHGAFRSLGPLLEERGSPTFESRRTRGPAGVYSVSNGPITGHSSDTRVLGECCRAEPSGPQRSPKTGGGGRALGKSPTSGPRQTPDSEPPVTWWPRRGFNTLFTSTQG